MTRKAIIILFGLLTAPALLASTFAQTGRSYPYAHIRYADGEVAIQRALEMEATEATVNVPVMPGDRLWTVASGRAEILFGDGSLLRMDQRTKVDFVAFGETAGEETLLRLWSGSLILRVTEAQAASYRIDTPSGSVFPVSEGLFRIDVDPTGTTTLSAYEGVAELASEAGSVLTRTGQRSFVQPGLRPESPFSFNTALYDSFDSWSDERDQQRRRTRRIAGVPDAIAVYAGALDHHGHWRHDPSHGLVWYPKVAIGWSPYTHGRWLYTAFGWTWVSYEPWGWAPYHFGRWGHSSLGWYWIPGVHWGPAWVSWAFGPTWVGWSPLGHHNRPIVSYWSVVHTRGGHAVSRRSGRHHAHGWTFVKKDHFKSVPVERTRLRVEDIRPTADRSRWFESGAILDRDLRPKAWGAAATAGTIRAPSRTTVGNRSRSIQSTRGERATIRPSPRGPSTTAPPNPSRSWRGGYAVPRSAPTVPRDVGRRSGGSDSRSPSGQVTERPGSGPSRGGSSRDDVTSSLGRIGVGPLRGPDTRLGTTERPRSSPSVGQRGAIRRASPSASTSRLPRADQDALGTRPLAKPSRAPSPEITRRPAIERSNAGSAGSKAFFGRRPRSVDDSPSKASGSNGEPRSKAEPRSRAVPRTRAMPRANHSGKSRTSWAPSPRRSPNRSSPPSKTRSGSSGKRNKGSSKQRNQ